MSNIDEGRRTGAPSAKVSLSGATLGEAATKMGGRSASNPSRRWFQRPLGITGIVLVALFVIGSFTNDPDGAPNDSANESKAATDQSESKKDAAETVETETVAESDAEPESEPAEPSPPQDPKPKTYLVTDVVDGDTLDLGNGKTVRIVGIDTPEVGECGYAAASDKLARLVLGKRVILTESDESTDQYGRLLRYVTVDGKDAGLRQIKSGLATARYDSRDGYGEHPREDKYIASDSAHKDKTCGPKPKPKPQPLVGNGGGNNDCMTGYTPCLPIRADLDCGEIGHPVQVSGGDPYRLDADGDGVGCDS